MMTQAGEVVTYGREDRSYNCEEERGASGIQILFHFLMWGGIYKTCKYMVIDWIAHFWWVNLNVSTLYFNTN